MFCFFFVISFFLVHANLGWHRHEISLLIRHSKKNNTKPGLRARARIQSLGPLRYRVLLGFTGF